ncbi:hypothetical protein HD554DRAFT_2282124 [Boletus coccyginus]|nr:hypothetical protein HD554DRAFT_2282124 [Boletus coccyginus]
MSELFTLNCWIRGDNTGGIFNIETSPNEEIGALNAPVPFDGLSAVTLSTSGELLADALKVSRVFATQPHEDRIHLIVDYPLILYYIRGNKMLSQLRTTIKAKHENLHSTPENRIAFYRPLASTTRHELDKSFDSLPVGSSFSMGILVSDAFLDVPVLQDICIIVQVTESQENGSDGLADFHTEIWDRKSDGHATVFVTMPVERPGVEVPSKCCIMKSPPYCNGSTRLSGVLIRNEFVLAVEDILAFYKGEDFAGDSKGNDDEVDATMEISVGAAESSMGEKPGIIVTGMPGIGKSLLLEFILHLRNLAGLPTLFVLDNRRVDLFASDGVFRCEGRIDRSELPPSVWALVDSNTDLIGVSEWVRSLGCFIVQAASPWPDRLHWALKHQQIIKSLYVALTNFTKSVKS